MTGISFEFTKMFKRIFLQNKCAWLLLVFSWQKYCLRALQGTYKNCLNSYWVKSAYQLSYIRCKSKSHHIPLVRHLFDYWIVSKSKLICWISHLSDIKDVRHPNCLTERIIFFGTSNILRNFFKVFNFFFIQLWLLIPSLFL